MVGVTAKLTEPPAEQITPFVGTLLTDKKAGSVAVTALLGDSQVPIISET